jgi:hypothetical protein
MASASQVRIPSRTAEGKHTPRFIIEVYMEASQRWVRSSNDGITGYFATRDDAQFALSHTLGYASTDLKYRVRQK